MYTASVARQREAVNTWSWPEELLDDLEASFSPERLDTYLAVAQGDRERALKLYTRNTELSAAFYGPLQGLEVALRNALHRELTRLYGAAWYDNLAAGLDRVALERIADAKRKIAPGGGTVTPSKMVARLFVRLLGLVARIGRPPRRGRPPGELRDDALAAGASARVPVPHAVTRIQAYQPLNALRKLRNRIAHHEPIFARPLLEDHERIVEVTGWISPGARMWIDRHSRVPLLLAASDDEAGVHF